MSTVGTLEQVTDAARVIAFGLRPKLIPSRDLSYAELVKRFAEDTAFRDLVEAVAEGLGMTVLGVSARTGIVFGPVADSAFEQKFDDYARRATVATKRESCTGLFTSQSQRWPFPVLMTRRLIPTSAGSRSGLRGPAAGSS